MLDFKDQKVNHKVFVNPAFSKRDEDEEDILQKRRPKVKGCSFTMPPPVRVEDTHSKMMMREEMCGHKGLRMTKRTQRNPDIKFPFYLLPLD